ncbi:MAG: ABC transporter permease subunit [Longimicrobiales bacterium]
MAGSTRGADGQDPGRRGPGGGGVLGTLFRYELKMLLRDRRMIFFSVVLPLILLPGFILIMRFTEGQAEERRETRSYEYAVVGSGVDRARALIDSAMALPDADTAGGLEEVRPADPDSALDAGDIDFIVDALSATDARARRDSIRAAEAAETTHTADPADPAGTDQAAPAVPVLELRFRGDNDESEAGAARMRSALMALRELRRHQVYRTGGLPVDPESVAVVERHEAASAERESGAQLALWLTPMLVMLMLSGGSIVAADAISGEKERGTLETLLTTSARRRDIVWAKQALIITTGVAITVINVANLALYLGLGLFELPERFVLSVAPVSLVLLLLLFLPLTVLISSALLMLSGYAKGYKEYQLYFFPVMLVFLVPSAAAVLPGMELASVIAFVPLANISVAVREVLVGEYSWAFLGVTIATTTGLAALMARVTERSLSTEKLITAAELDEADLRGGPALFPRRVLRWFAVLWALLFVTSAAFGGALGIRGQVAFNLLVLFLGASVLMAWRYRLDLREALALRWPRPAVWPAVLLGAPSAFITGVGVAQLGQLVFPIPERVIEAFGQFMVPEDIPLWQVVVFLAVLPGIIEELTFRGLLLHGLRKRLRPVALALATGVIFGFFHVELFRLFPTAYLGTILAAVTLLTGSIFPAMLWHALNNAVALVPDYLGWWPDVVVIPWWGYAAGVIGLAVAFGIIWTNRTVYPGLRDTPDTPDAPAPPDG